jgi:hypothetical protein
VSSSARGFLPAFLFFNHGLRRGKARDWNSEWRGAHVVHSDAMAKFHTGPVAAMLATDSNLKVGSGGTPSLDAPLDQHAHARNIQ